MYVCLAPHQWPEVARSKLEQVEVLLWVELFFPDDFATFACLTKIAVCVSVKIQLLSTFIAGLFKELPESKGKCCVDLML